MQKTHSGTGEDTLWLIDIGGEGGRGSAQVSEWCPHAEWPEL